MGAKLFPKRQQLGYLSGAFLLAFLLWLFVTSHKYFTINIEVPIEVRNIQAKKTLRQEIPHTAQVHFKGTGGALLETYLLKNFFDLKLVVDLEKMQTEYDFNLNEYFAENPQKIYIPNSFDIEFIEVVYPDSLHIELDDIMVKTVPVVSQFTVTAAPGYLIMGRPQISPREIEVSGPKELVRQIKAVKMIPDTVSQASLAINESIPLQEHDRLVNYSHTSIDYYLDIQAIGERIISDIPVSVTNVLPNLRVFVMPRTVSLTITGGVEQIASIGPEDIKVEIDFSVEWNPRKQFYEPRVTVPAGLLHWSDLSPKNLELVVTRDNN